MRIIAGKFRGVRLKSPPKTGVRPTSSRTREAVFNILIHGDFAGFNINTARVLDLFAGTGALGLEALSRGAQACVFIEQSAAARAIIRANIEALELMGVTRIFRRDAAKLGAIGTLRPFDLVFVDPPYGQGLGEQACLSACSGGWLAPGALIVLEENANISPALPDPFEPVSEKSYGTTKIHIYRFSDK